MSAQVFAVILPEKTTAGIVRVQYRFWFLHSCLFLLDLNSCFNSVLLVLCICLGVFGSCLDSIAILFLKCDSYFGFMSSYALVYFKYCSISVLAFLCLCLLHSCSDFLFSLTLHVLVLVLCPFPVLIWRVSVTCNYFFPPVFCRPVSYLLSVRAWSLYEILAFSHPWFWILGFLLDFLCFLCPTFCVLYIAMLHTVGCVEHCSVTIYEQ